MDEVVKHIEAFDLDLWYYERRTFQKKLMLKLESHNIKYGFYENLNFFAWNEKIRDTKFVIFSSDDICPEIWFEDLESTCKKYNLQAIIITNNFFTKSIDTAHIKIVFVEELFGEYYNPHIRTTHTGYKNLYTCLMQRTGFSRLNLFLDLRKNNLLDRGNVSLLGYQIDEDKTADAVLQEILDQHNIELDFNLDLPFRNFVDEDSTYKIEQQSKYDIVCETYNDHAVPYRIAYTEKTFRSLQIPNISLILNKKGSNKILNDLGFKTHKINCLLDGMIEYNCQNDFIVSILENDYVEEDQVEEFAKHNSNKLKKLNEKLHNESFADEIVKNI